MEMVLFIYSYKVLYILHIESGKGMGVGMHESGEHFKMKPFTGINLDMYKKLNVMKKAKEGKQALHDVIF